MSEASQLDEMVEFAENPEPRCPCAVPRLALSGRSCRPLGTRRRHPMERGLGRRMGGYVGCLQTPCSSRGIWRTRSFGRILTGAILGGGLGIGASILVGMTPVGIRDTPAGTILEVLLNVDWNATLPALRQALLASLTGMQEHAIPGAIVGVLLGHVWGACRR